jgi:electron transfer flavoprotein beta subunit
VKIVVIVKEVPDTEAKVLIKDGKPDFAGAKMVINPYDEYAIEEALRVAERAPGSSVVAVMIASSAESRATLVKVLALGVDGAVLIEDSALTGAGPLECAQVLCAAVQELAPDLILAGRQGVDYDWGLTPIALAELLGVAHVGLAGKLELADGVFKAIAEGDDGTQVFEGKLPVVITADKSLNEPRYASLKNIMAAKKKPIVEKNLAALGLDPAVVGAVANKVSVVGCEYPPQKQAGRVIQGETVEDKVRELLSALRNEAKVI